MKLNAFNYNTPTPQKMFALFDGCFVTNFQKGYQNRFLILGGANAVCYITCILHVFLYF